MPVHPFQTPWPSSMKSAGSARRRVLALGMCALAVTATAACGGGDTAGKAGSAAPTTAKSSTPAPSGSSAPAASQAVITIKDFGFETPPTVPAGATITVKNADGTAHSVTASGSGGFDVTIPPHASATFTAPDKSGDYPYVCKFHGNMKGTLTVG